MQDESESISKNRSPWCPRSSLEDAVELSRQLFAKAGRSSIAPEVAVKALGYKGISGASLAILGALSQYGLINRGKGEVSITPLALRLVHPTSATDESAAKKEAALNPRVFARIFESYHDCSEDILASHLIHEDFPPDGARRAAQIYKVNSEFAKLVKSGYDGPIAEDSAPEDEPRATPPAKKPMISQILEQQLPIPLGDRMANIPMPISEEDFELLIQTLNLWKSRLIRPRPENPEHRP